MEALRVLEIIVGIMFSRCPVGIMTRDRLVEGDKLLVLRWRMCQSRANSGHISGSRLVTYILGT